MGHLPLTETVEEYREYLFGQGLKPKTVRNYAMKVAAALDWCDRHDLDLQDLRPSQMGTLAGEWPNTYSTRGQLRCALIHFWDMCDVPGVVGSIPVPPQPPGAWRGIEDEDTKRLLAAARGDWPRGAVIYLGVYLGMRREEIASLRWSDFDSDLRWVRIQGKGDRVRRLPVHPKVRGMLKPNRWPGEWVFSGRLNSNSHVSTTTISNWVAEIAEKAGLGHMTPHQLRHISGGKVYEETDDIYAAKAWLGHANVKTTQTYVPMRAKRLVTAMESLNWEGDADDLSIVAPAAGPALEFHPSSIIGAVRDPESA
ncbi:MAG: tyrosine-type recombinase/integrase [Actinomycetota bacterium]